MQIQAEAIDVFDGEDLGKIIPSDQKVLSFPIGARITVLQKGSTGANETQNDELQIWLGRYNNEVGKSGLIAVK
jgi:hypothetical protein